MSDKSYYKELYNYFNNKAVKYKSYKTTASRFERDDFDVIGCGGAWWFEFQIYHEAITNKTYKQIKKVMYKIYKLEYLYK